MKPKLTSLGLALILANYTFAETFSAEELQKRNIARRAVEAVICQGELLASLTRWYTPAEVLAMATSVNAELLALSGLRNPYPGKLGRIDEGALADLLLVDGDPLANIKMLEDPGKTFVVIMKDGKIYKNTLSK